MGKQEQAAEAGVQPPRFEVEGVPVGQGHALRAHRLHPCRQRPPRQLRQPGRLEDAVDVRCARGHALLLQDVGDLVDRQTPGGAQLDDPVPAPRRRGRRLLHHR